MGPCMCGDPYCPSCGPAQGANPAQEMVEEWLCGLIEENGGLDLPPEVDLASVVGRIVDIIGRKASPALIDALEVEAARASREARQRVRVEATRKAQAAVLKARREGRKGT